MATSPAYQFDSNDLNELLIIVFGAFSVALGAYSETGSFKAFLWALLFSSMDALYKWKTNNL